jgi:acyl-CoA thioesterase-1
MRIRSWAWAGRHEARALTAATALVAVVACSASSAKDKAVDTAIASRRSESKPAAPAAVPANQRQILFVGTSLTAGLGLEPDSAYPMLIQRKIDSAGLPFEVVNAGVSGETSSGLLDRLDWLLRGQFALMVLETGANDGLRGIAPSVVKSNLEAALTRIKSKRPDARVVLVQMEALPNLGPKYAAEFHAVYPAVAKEQGVPLLPFLLTDVAGHRDLNQADGVHPNYRGERIVAANVWKELRPILDSIH